METQKNQNYRMSAPEDPVAHKEELATHVQLDPVFHEKVVPAIDGMSEDEIITTLVRSRGSGHLRDIRNTADLVKDHLDKKKVTKELEELSRIDSKTQLGNERALNVDVARHIEHAQFADNTPELWVYLSDLDSFKPVNDELGHAAGDKILVIAAQAHREVFQPRDSIYRPHGDEFIALLQKPKIGAHPTPDLQETFNTKINKELERLIGADEELAELLRSKGIKPSISGGLADFNLKEDEWADVKQLADERMYADKRAKKLDQENLNPDLGHIDIVEIIKPSNPGID